jgi:hypothetical protein
MGRRVYSSSWVAPVTLGITLRHPRRLDVDVVAPGLRAMLSTSSLSHGVRTLQAAPAGTAVSAGIVGGMFGLVEALARATSRTIRE